MKEGFDMTCALLEAKKINLIEKTTIEVSDADVIQYCEGCHLKICRLDDLDGREFRYQKAVAAPSEERTYSCSKCGEIVTLTFTNGKMDNTRKFVQVGDIIYHVANCGECRRIG